MRFLLRPGWLALIAVVIGFAVAAFTLLAPWQFGREAQRDAQQRAIDTASATAPVPLAELVPPGETVTAESGSAVPDYPPPPAGTVTLTARLRLDETDPQGRAAIESDGHRQVYAADSRSLAAATGLALEPGFLQLTAGQPGVLRPLDVAPTSGGEAPFTNFSYALQWLTFGVIALFALGYFVRLELLQRRGGRADKAALRRALAGDDG